MLRVVLPHCCGDAAQESRSHNSSTYVYGEQFEEEEEDSVEQVVAREEASFERRARDKYYHYYCFKWPFRLIIKYVLAL